MSTVSKTNVLQRANKGSSEENLWGKNLSIKKGASTSQCECLQGIMPK